MSEESDSASTEKECAQSKTVPKSRIEELAEESVTHGEKASILSELLSDKEYEEIFRKAVRICKSRGLSEAEAEDIAQDTIIVLNKNPPPADVELIKWVHGILRHKISRALKYRQRFDNKKDYSDNGSFISSQKQFDWDEKKLLIILNKCFNECLEELNEQENALFIRYKVVDSKQDSVLRQQIAKEMEIEYGALRVRINRIMDKLGKCMEKCCEKDQFARKWENYVTKDNLKSYINQKFEN